MTSNALPYEDPSIEIILVLSSFLLLLNGVGWLLNITLFCGLLGQILVGIAWGSPGLKLLAEDAEKTVTQLGYIGLILLVFEGGLLSSFNSLKSTLWLSVSVAITGVTVPISLSFLLRYITDATFLQCFAAGAALCSTSLGTTITVLQTSGYVHTRLGTVLTSAALLDDVIGLLMAQIIQDLGVSQSSVQAVDIIRPIASSIGLMVVMIVVCKFIIRPLTTQAQRLPKSSRLSALTESSITALIAQLSILIGLVTAASYAGASNLLAAYASGATISWWYSIDSCTVPTPPRSLSGNSVANAAAESSAVRSPSQDAAVIRDGGAPESAEVARGATSDPHLVYEIYLAQVVDRVLKPMFFASIGFSVPVTLMFAPEVIWRGIVYSVLMTFGKLLAGLWLIRLGLFDLCCAATMTLYQKAKLVREWIKKDAKKRDAVELRCDARSTTATDEHQTGPPVVSTGPEGARISDATSNPPSLEDSRSSAPSHSSKPPISLYPGLILGSAMVARGEIGYLIASLAHSNGLLSRKRPPEPPNEDTFLVIIWAISLCTLLGPLATGLLVRRVKRLETTEQAGGRAFNPLGSWGEL